jgi:beta-lactamase class A
MIRIPVVRLKLAGLRALTARMPAIELYTEIWFPLNACRFLAAIRLARLGASSLGLAKVETTMFRSRRDFVKTAAAAAALTTLPVAAPTTAAGRQMLTPDQIADLFENLPGDKAFKIVAPPANNNPGFLVQSNAKKRLFVASAIKTFVLCEALRQVDSPDVVETLENAEITLDSTVWSLGSPTFNPPDLSGIVSERTTLEAMITRSDNTATDMILKLVGTESVRRFVASAGLSQTLVPDSTRALTAYVFGATNYLTITWEELLQVIQGPLVHPFFNNVETLASSADDLVSYYSRALQGQFFKHSETLNEFRRVLTLCDFIYLVPLPLGVSAYAKSGNADAPGFHARSIAGGLFFSDQWVYFAFVLNWDAESGDDPDTVDRFFSAIHQALSLVKESRSSRAR